jgi:transcriptional regulator
MYNLSEYKEEDKKLVIQFMKENPFITLVGCDQHKRVVATQVPVLIETKDDKIILSGHIMRNTDHAKAFCDNPEALALFTGPHTYISGTMYTGNLQQASTWNYITVHARGRLNWMDDGGLIIFLKKLTLHFENNNTNSTTIYDNLPQDYVDRLRPAIMGFEMEIKELENVFKLSQNRDEKSYDNVVYHLSQQEGDARHIGELMGKRKGKVFPGK